VRNLGSQLVTAAVVTGLVSALTLSAAIASAATAPVEGVTSDSVKIGFIYSKTGVASATSGDSDVGCKARVGRENANGGVGGRKLDIQYVDDQSSGANLTSAQNLVQNQHVFMVINDSAFAFLTYRWLLDHNVPLIGGGFDGTYYGAPGNEKVISAFGNAAPVEGVSYDVGPKIAKALGATKMASLGYGVSPSSTAAAKSNGKYAAPAAGLKSVYTNTTVDFGSTDVGPIVLGLKNAGADAVYLPLDGNTNLAIAQGLQQNNVPMKAVLMASGYGQAMLDSPITKTLNSADIVSQIYKPAELKNDPAVKKFRADLKKYGGITGVPDYGAYTGYLSCDLAITGLQQAGKNPTGQGFVDGIRNLGTYKAADLTCQPLDMSLKNFGKTPTRSCQYFVTFKNGKFVVMNNGKPIFGKLVGDPALIAANNQGQAADVTTTAPPASTP